MRNSNFKKFEASELKMNQLIVLKGGTDDKKKEADSEVAIEELEIVCESWTMEIN